MKVTCKHCGSENITENNIVPASCGISAWGMDGGVPVVVDYSGATTYHHDAIEVARDKDGRATYHCGDCDADLTVDALCVDPHPGPWEGLHGEMAMAEGWCLSNDSEGYVQLQRTDELGVFRSDAEALAYVANRAARGSELHRRALIRLAGESG